MFDWADLATMLSELVSLVFTAVSLVAAVAAVMGFVYHRWKSNSREASFSGQLAAYFLATTVLCGISLVSGFALFSIEDYQYGSWSRPFRALTGAIGFLWGPVAAGVLGSYCLRKGFFSHEGRKTADPGSQAAKPDD